MAEVNTSFQTVHSNFSEGGKSYLICTAQKTTLFSSLRATYPKNKTNCHQHGSDIVTGDCWHCEQSTLPEGAAVPSWRNRGVPRHQTPPVPPQQSAGLWSWHCLSFFLPYVAGPGPLLLAFAFGRQRQAGNLPRIWPLPPPLPFLSLSLISY